MFREGQEKVGIHCLKMEVFLVVDPAPNVDVSDFGLAWFVGCHTPLPAL